MQGKFVFVYAQIHIYLLSIENLELEYWYTKWNKIHLFTR